ncbi:MAG: hypothetical protein H7099_20485 [Gemmatimonadaceae bacterium]|nr:hypothetical protein [Gemmatimonadaceae bacterium]
MMRSCLGPVVLTLAWLCAACGDGDSPVTPVVPEDPAVPAMTVLGQGVVTARYTAEISVGARYAYSSSWGTRTGARGDMIYVWDLLTSQPTLTDSVQVADAGTTGDVQVVDDANLLVVAIEPSPRGAIAIYDLTDPAHPQFIRRHETANTVNGVHTAQVTRVDGRLYAFLCIDPRNGERAKLVIVDITDPRAPVETWVQPLGAPFVHDVFVRDGILITAEWNDGVAAYDIGGGGRGGSPSAPVLLGRLLTQGGSVHNVYWQRDSVSGAKYLFVGEEGPGAIGSSSVGDVHVVDVTSWSAMREVAFFRVSGAGTHNFFVDEPQGVLYAAYYNAGLRAVDVRGDLSSCPVAARDASSRCDLALAGRTLARGLTTGGYVWGVDGRGDMLVASDMLRGVFRLARVTR